MSVDLSDAMNRAYTMVGIQAAYLPVTRVAGPAVTVSLPVGGINMLKMAMELCQAGDVLVVDVHGDTSAAMWGGNVSSAMHNRGVLAVVVDGAIRDVSQLRSIPFPAFSRGIAAAAQNGAAARGEVNFPVACGGVVVNPGDVIVADEDGVVCVPQDALEEVAEKAAEFSAKYAGWQPITSKGGVPDIDAIRDDLVASGCKFE